jgi:hypothetical protein
VTLTRLHPSRGYFLRDKSRRCHDAEALAREVGRPRCRKSEIARETRAVSLCDEKLQGCPTLQIDGQAPLR